LGHLVGDGRAQADLAPAARGLGRLDGCLYGCHQDFSSVLALRGRLGLGVSSMGAAASGSCAGSSGSKPSFLSFTRTGAVSGAGMCVTMPSSRSLSTVMIRAMSCRPFGLWPRARGLPAGGLERVSFSALAYLS